MTDLEILEEIEVFLRMLARIDTDQIKHIKDFRETVGTFADLLDDICEEMREERE